MPMKVSIGGALLSLAAATAAVAQNDDEALRQNCTGDYFQFCSAYDPDSAAVEQCFDTNLSKLSPGCRSAIESYVRRNPGGRKKSR